MSGQPPQLPVLSSWQAQILRLTAFPVEPAAAIEKEWWKDILGESPDTSTRKKLQRTAEGTWEGKAVALTVDAQRIEWAFVPRVDPLDMPDAILAIGSFPIALQECSKLFERFLDMCPPLSRLAFGTILLQPTASRESGYRQINEYLPDVRLSPESTDFLYRINRPRMTRTEIAGLKINRLSTWSIMKWTLRMTAEAQSGAIPLSTQESNACRLELDINTDQAFTGPLPAANLRPLWNELAELGQEIAVKGDIS